MLVDGGWQDVAPPVSIQIEKGHAIRIECVSQDSDFVIGHYRERDVRVDKNQVAQNKLNSKFQITFFQV